MTGEKQDDRQLAERLRDAGVPGLLSGARVDDLWDAWWVVDAEQRVVVAIDGSTRRKLRPGEERWLRLDFLGLSRASHLWYDPKGRRAGGPSVST